ncbi:MAG: TetR/AcrR family transcriptional regulator [Ilumatobacter sp.]|jgi:AcrR family transcriptional regulator|uniref:TetR/AcrR family transcriptional regulator n=1 Tax=Ilumatobacter sp. TaxID=1967498 RepID=UPI00391BB9B5
MADTRTATRGDLSSEAIVAAALRIIEEDGLDVLTGTRIADELGVTQPAIYRHVDGVDDVWRGLGLVGRQQLAESLMHAAIGRSGADAIRSVAHAWLTFTREHRALYAATDRYPCAGDPDLEAAVDTVVGVLAAALRGYGLPEAAAVDASRLLRSFLHGFAHLEAGDGHPHPLDNDESFERIVELLITVLPALDPAVSHEFSPGTSTPDPPPIEAH